MSKPGARKPALLVVLLGSVVTIAAACGVSRDGSSPDDFGDAAASPEASPTTPPLFPDGATGDASVRPCTGLCLQQVACDDGKSTTVRGKVHDPAGKVPLYNVLVYVPNAALAPVVTGATCERCGAVSGDPLVSTLTDATGAFTLTNVPVGTDIPVVVQVGKWRKLVKLPEVKRCETLDVTDKEVFRLPKSTREGDMPQMAIATGSADPFECLLTKMGIDPQEMTLPIAKGRVHVYRENGVDTNPPTALANTLWGSLDTLKKYDIVMLPCEGAAKARPGTDTTLSFYANAGGRIFTTHYGFSWLDQGNRPFASTGTFSPDKATGGTGSRDFQIDTSFPKGQAFADWLVAVGASTTRGTISVSEWRHDLDAEKNPPAQRWVYGTTTAGPSVQHMTFNTPLAATEDRKCGRVVYSDFHVSANAQNPNVPFPASCKAGDLSAQEKALEFMLFDLSSCIQSDKDPPKPPPVIR
jgi:hypothetical protein